MTHPSTIGGLFSTRATFRFELIDGATCVVIDYPELGSREVVRPDAFDYPYLTAYIARLKAEHSAS